MLSAPLQFMSQAEKRAKQMQVMGIDESDIVDVSTTGSKKGAHDDGDNNQQQGNKLPSTPNNKAINVVTQDDNSKI